MVNIKKWITVFASHFLFLTLSATEIKHTFISQKKDISKSNVCIGNQKHAFHRPDGWQLYRYSRLPGRVSKIGRKGCTYCNRGRSRCCVYLSKTIYTHDKIQAMHVSMNALGPICAEAVVACAPGNSDYYPLTRKSVSSANWHPWANVRRGLWGREGGATGLIIVYA